MDRKTSIVLGILAHVDAGKTTLTENILYETGVIKKTGRVDSRDTCLDSHSLEKQRGITIFSSQACFEYNGQSFMLLDTPGHTDFSAEMERTLSVLDYAILVVSAAEGVQGHTYTLWKLLERYGVPAFIFVNKMDRCDVTEQDIIGRLCEKLDHACAIPDDEEGVSLCDEELLNEYIDNGSISDNSLKKAIKSRKVFPVYFGSALKDEGVTGLLEGLRRYALPKKADYDGKFSARVYKITNDSRHNRLTHLRIESGSLRPRDRIGEEKVNEIRLYTGEGYKAVQEARTGDICAVTGIEASYPGQGIGCEDTMHPILEPVMTYRVIIPPEVSPVVMMDHFRELAEESPELEFSWEQKTGEIHVRIMGIIQLEILKCIVKERYDIDIEFGAGSILYKETLADHHNPLTDRVEGIGHFEPLRHYAEVHLIIEPGERGSGVIASADVSEDQLAKNWQRLILTHILEKTHAGVLTGSELTDVKITLKAGRAHLKHTEGGDFRQATYRAIRQGLMQAENVLLEPYYDFSMRMPQNCIGRAMTDVEKMSGKCSPPVISGDEVILEGYAPVSRLWDYHTELTSYTKGLGSLTVSMRGYDICHNQDEIITKKNYDPDSDLRNPSGSVFCEHGAGIVIPWNEVPRYMHIESVLGTKRNAAGVPVTAVRTAKTSEWLDSDEVDAILKKAAGANKKSKGAPRSKTVKEFGHSVSSQKPVPVKPRYLLVDGYNIIFAWDELKSLAAANIDSARLKLEDIVSNYAGYLGIETAVVFDAYRVENHKTEMLDYHNLHVVFTATAETADHYIERFTHENASKYDIIVATSDGIEQIIITSKGCRLMSASSFYEEVRAANNAIAEIINGSF